MRPVAHPHQDRPDLEAIALHLEDIPHPRSRIGIGENQHIRGPHKAAAGEDPLAQIDIEGRVDVHLALIDEIAGLAVEDLERAAHPAAGVDVHISKLRMRTQRDIRRDAKAPHMAGAADDGLGDLFGRGEDTRKKTEDKRLAKCTFGSQST